MTVEQGSSSYIPKEQQPPVQPEVVYQRHPEEGAIRSLKRIKHIGPLMAVMLAANLGLVGAAKTTDSREPEVRPQAMTDSIQNGGYETQDPVDPSKPQHWNKGGTQDPIYNFQDGIFYEGLSSVGAQYYGTGGLCSMDTNSWTSDDFPVDKNKTYTENFQSEFIPGPNHPNVNVGPITRVYWKDSLGNAVGTPDAFQPTYTVGAGSWENFTRVYGPDGVAIPTSATQASITIGINGISFEQGCDTFGTVNYDKLSFTSEAQSVGGIAQEVNTDTLPANSTSSGSSNSKEIYAMLAGTVIGTLALGAAGVKIRSTVKEQRK